MRVIIFQVYLCYKKPWCGAIGSDRTPLKRRINRRKCFKCDDWLKEWCAMEWRVKKWWQHSRCPAWASSACADLVRVTRSITIRHSHFCLDTHKATDEESRMEGYRGGQCHHPHTESSSCQFYSPSQSCQVRWLSTIIQPKNEVTLANFKPIWVEE